MKLYLNKTLHTMKILMRLLAIGFHFNRIKQMYTTPEKVTVEQVVVLMNRCVKLYEAVEHLNTVFRLMRKKREI